MNGFVFPFILVPCAVAAGAACSSGVPSSKPETPATTTSARVVPVSTPCRGAHLTVDAELSACACDETEHVVDRGTPMVREGRWCGLPHHNERRPANLAVSAERVVLAPGEGTNVLLRITNVGPETSVYRVSNRHLSARLVLANGQPFPDAAHTSGPSNDEALFELPPQGVMELRVPVPGTYSRWVGTGESARVEPAKLSPGMFAIEVSLGGLGGEGSRLVPIEVR